MQVRAVQRQPGAFQRPVSAGQIQAMCRRAFGPAAGPVSAVELGLGAYNNTYRVTLRDRPPVILRVAPEPGRQFRIERELMRNEHATVPFLAGLGDLLPRTLAADFTHQLLGRDYLFQTLLDGVAAPDGLSRYPRPAWAGFFGQLGGIARTIHGVAGDRFGMVAGPGHATWSQALIGYFADAADDLRDAGLDADDAHRLAEAAREHRAVLDEIARPRLLHGDLWTVNVLLDPDADEPTIVGVVDSDRAWWGDPLADWTIYRAGLRQGAERQAFFAAYGELPAGDHDRLRARFYLARHLLAILLERFRLGETDLSATYRDVREVLVELG